MSYENSDKGNYLEHVGTPHQDREEATKVEDDQLHD
jgi:hypothetical protein